MAAAPCDTPHIRISVVQLGGHEIVLSDLTALSQLQELLKHIEGCSGLRRQDQRLLHDGIEVSFGNLEASLESLGISDGAMLTLVQKVWPPTGIFKGSLEDEAYGDGLGDSLYVCAEADLRDRNAVNISVEAEVAERGAYDGDGSAYGGCDRLTGSIDVGSEGTSFEIKVVDGSGNQQYLHGKAGSDEKEIKLSLPLAFMDACSGVKGDRVAVTMTLCDPE
eukprot:TRINITY_DN4688_c0_g2_i1.p1 TRINITY_DN4688_c0_g2~~TRINITY_DN4688_c0_g2_i1.p1  ORF type:complete len:247 (+),score=39.45 TRINITY_DN4688_c0_g2_i1:79-741(+)